MFICLYRYVRPEVYAGNPHSARSRTELRTANKSYQRKDLVAFLCLSPGPSKPQGSSRGQGAGAGTAPPAAPEPVRPGGAQGHSARSRLPCPGRRRGLLTCDRALPRVRRDSQGSAAPGPAQHFTNYLPTIYKLHVPESVVQTLLQLCQAAAMSTALGRLFSAQPPSG